MILLDIEVFDPAKLPQRESNNDKAELVSCSHTADDGVWVGHNEALDRTISAMGKIFLDTLTVEQSETSMASPTGLMWPKRCLFGRSMCQLFLC